MTITEGGYNIDKVTGEFNLKDENISHDLRDPLHPRTIFGYVTEGLRRRRQLSDSEGLTILSCDNLQHNGRTACHAFTSFIAAQDPSLLPYLSQNVTFPNSMVDRITPATTPADVARLNLKNGTSDAAPVYCEDFIQWVIEDKFIAGRPLLESVGVEFTTDVSSYETMKLSLLNASHTMLSYPAFLSGYRRVDEAMGDVRFSRYLRNFMDYDITPYVPAPGNINLDIYKQTLIERFSNSAVSDQLSRLCGDGVSKIPIYLMPNVSKLIIDHMNLKHVTFLIASYRHYLKYRRDDRGESYEIVEPWLTERDLGLIASEDPVDFLRLSAFSGVDLLSSEDFVKIYIEMVSGIKSRGTLAVLESIISQKTSNL
jgi:mannitol 2-dehydrogenase